MWQWEQGWGGKVPIPGGVINLLKIKQLDLESQLSALDSTASGGQWSDGAVQSSTVLEQNRQTGTDQQPNRCDIIPPAEFDSNSAHTHRHAYHGIASLCQQGLWLIWTPCTGLSSVRSD